MRKPTQRGSKRATDRIAEAVRRRPRAMTLMLAQELGVPEVEIIRALPPERVEQLDVARWEEIVRNLEALDKVRVLVSSGGATLEAIGVFGGFSRTGAFFNVQNDTLDMHIRWKKLAAAFAVEKPGHVNGVLTQSVQFYDSLGAAAFKVFLGFGSEASAEQQVAFQALRQRFRLERPESET